MYVLVTVQQMKSRIHGAKMHTWQQSKNTNGETKINIQPRNNKGEKSKSTTIKVESQFPDT